MAITYRNTQDGRTATVPEPDDEPVRRQRPRALVIKRFDAAPQWERIDTTAGDTTAGDTTAGDAGAPPPPPQTGVEIREAGGGWYELVADGQVVNKVRGREAADQAATQLAGS